MSINYVVIAMVLTIISLLVVGCTQDTLAPNAMKAQEIQTKNETVMKAAPSAQECEELEEMSMETIEKEGKTAAWKECEEQEREAAMEDPSQDSKESEQHEESDEGVEENAQPAMRAKNYYRYDETHFRQSLADGKIVFLNFYANWCPSCKKDQPKIFEFFNQLDDPNVVGYEVHYNDDETIDEDKEAAKKYRIAYQHTTVILNPQGSIVKKTLEGFNSEEIIQAISEAKQ